MKKRIIALSALSILGTMGLSGCKDVTDYVVDGKDVIVTIGSGDARENYTADDLFDDYLSTSSGASAAFNAVYDVLVDKAVAESQEINNYVEGKVIDLQEKAESTAKTNGSTYKEELSNLLESENVEDLDEYKKKVRLSYKKEQFEEDYYEKQLYSDMTKTVDTNTLHAEYIKNENPYHVRHILVKVSAAGNNFFPSAETISSSEAKNLGNVIKNLASPSMTFGNVAEFYSEDGSSSNFGSLNELMGRKTSYVNEFKFAVFGYDAYINSAVTDGANSLGIPTEVANINTKEAFEDSVNFIPFAVADQLLEYAELTKPVNGENYKDGKIQYYPRNVLFHNYFSNHGLSFIEKDASITDSSRFTTVKFGGVDHEVLSDENGRPILVTRAGTGSADSGYQGVHFIVIENSPVDGTLEEEVKYYSTDVPKTDADVSNDKRYVTFVNTDKQNYSSRAKEIESAVKSYDPNIKFRLYDEAKKMIEDSGVKVTINEKISDSITEYRNYTVSKSIISNEENYEDSWKTYNRLLTTQEDFNSYKIYGTSEWTAIKTAFGIK